MGIFNCSPNSFYAPAHSVEEALRHAGHMIETGADIIDIGGEATNPNVDLQKESPQAEEELRRVLPVMEAIKRRFSIKISIDTSQPFVMQKTIEAGVDIINDQRALSVPGAVETVANSQASVVLMHWFHPPRTPGSTSLKKLYEQVVQDLQRRIQVCVQHGISRSRIILDPGFGQGHYGINTTENIYLLQQLNHLCALGFPVLVGWSRKSMIGDLLGGVGPDQRLYGSLAAAVFAAQQGATLIRTHDVQATKQALTVWQALTTSSLD